ncbi:MAG: DUF2017 family protein [Microbacteriaceae bacterium]
MTDRIVVLEMARVEGAHLIGLVSQFSELLESSGDGTPVADPAILRLVPDGYADADAAREFRSLTESELLARRQSDAALVIASLADFAELDQADHDALVSLVEVPLDAENVQAWLRTLAAIRLVLATRLGIIDEDDHDEEDPRFGIYHWLGYRLDGLVRAIDGD